jgi:hypothetical protein
MPKIPSKRQLPATLRGAGFRKYQFYMNGGCLWRARVSDTLSASSSYAARPPGLSPVTVSARVIVEEFFKIEGVHQQRPEG